MAAIITDADYSGRQRLVVFPPDGWPFNVTCAHDHLNHPGTWHWPEYIPAK